MSDADQAVRDVVKGASIVYVGLFLELLIAFVAQVLAARYLSVSGFGGLTTGTALLDIGSVVAGLGLASGLTRYLPRIDAAKKRILAYTTGGVTLAISTAIGVVVSFNAGFVANTVFNDPTITPSIRIFGAAIPFSALLNLAIGGIRGQKQSLYQVYVKNILHPVLRFVFIVVALTWGLGQAGFAGAYALPYVLSAAVAILLFHRTLPDIRGAFDQNLTEEVMRYSLPFTITSVSGFVYRSSDIFLILYFLDSTAVGIYGVAYAAVSFMGMFSTAFNFLGAPVASELESGGKVEEVMRVFRSVVRWLVITSVCALVPLAIFSTEFITTIYQSKYASGGLPLAVLAVGFALKNVLIVHGPILKALGKSKTLSFNSAAAAVSNVALNLVLIPTFGIVGAAVATSLSFVLRDGLATIQTRHYLGTVPITWQAIGPVIVAAPLLGAFALFVAPHVPATLPWLLVMSSLFGAVYIVIVLLAFGLSETEVMIIRSAEERYGIDIAALDWLVRRLS